MARKLSTVNKGRSAPTPKSKSRSNRTEYDWSGFTGKLGTVKLVQTGGEDGKRTKLYRSTGRGGPWVSVYFNDPLDERIATVHAGILLEVGDENCRLHTSKNDNDQVMFDMFPEVVEVADVDEDGNDLDENGDIIIPGRTEVITVGGFPDEATRDEFRSVTVTA